MDSLGGKDTERFSRTMERFMVAWRSVTDLGPVSQTAAGTLSRLDGDGPLSVSELARFGNVSQPAMTQLIDRMEADGLVRREPSPSDGRIRLVWLTDAGRDGLAEHRRLRAESLEPLIAELNPAERQALMSALDPFERLAGIAQRAARAREPD